VCHYSPWQVDNRVNQLALYLINSETEGEQKRARN
jgi:hypothetical protein